MKAVFWNKAVLFFWTVQELLRQAQHVLLLGTRLEEQDVGPKATADRSVVAKDFM